MSASNDAAGKLTLMPESSREPARGTGAGGLSAQALCGALQGIDVDLEVVVSTPSTNADLVARARSRAVQRTVLRAASRQTAGRGRLGRVWHDAAEGSILFSIALPWRGDPASTCAVTLACGLALAQCLRAHDVAAELKWPNDILLAGRKLAGILTETAEDPHGRRTLVIGLGLNLALDSAQRRALGAQAADLAQRFGRASVRAQREQWLARLARAIIEAAQQFETRGFAELRERFNAHFAYLGQTVVVACEGQTALRGIARGVDDQGRLLIEHEGTLHALISGDLSLRRQVRGTRRLGDPR